jgi:hypothetical protein
LVTPGGATTSGGLGEERRESLVGRGRGSPLGRMSRRRRSLDDISAGFGGERERETEEEVREVVVRDRQLRGYGIGGAGNIRQFSFLIELILWVDRGLVLTCRQDGRQEHSFLKYMGHLQWKFGTLIGQREVRCVEAGLP